MIDFFAFVTANLIACLGLWFIWRSGVLQRLFSDRE